MNPIATAQYGLFAATQKFGVSAQRTAQASLPGSDVDYAAEAVNQIESKQAFTANVAVIRTADRMTGDLLNLLA